ncbi:MAG: VOC family protein [Bacteroidota bacterium]
MKTHNLALNQVTVYVTELERSFRFYQQFGLLPIVKSPHYARFIVPGNEATFSLHIAEKVDSSTVIYFETPNVDEKVEALRKEGFDFVLEPTEQEWHWREAYLEDPDGNRICIYHAGVERMNPEWRLQESKKNHLLTTESFHAWLNSYKTAWEQGKIEIIEALFSVNAQYYETPFEAPLKGIDNVLEYWKGAFDNQENITFGFDIIQTLHDKGFAKWNASFTRRNSGIKVSLNGIFEVCFDADLKCTHFYEWWHINEKS